MTSEQSRVLYVILTARNQKFMDECLKQVTNRMDLLTSALLPKVWQETHTMALNAPDSMSQVNSDSTQQKKQTVGQIDQKGKGKQPAKCMTCGKMHRGVCRKAKKVPGPFNNCKTNKKP